MQHTPTLFFFFFNDTATPEIYTLSLHDALPISIDRMATTETGPPATNQQGLDIRPTPREEMNLYPLDTFPYDYVGREIRIDRKSTRLNSSHDQISYAVFCLKKKKKHK